MNNRSPSFRRCIGNVLLAVLVTVSAKSTIAQVPVPVDEDGNPLQPTVSEVVANNAIDGQLPAFTANELTELVGPIALYPDNLLAIILPASAYPLQIVLAARFLEELESDSTLQADESFDESVIALLNYPEVVQMMNENIQWTWQLGDAVVGQETDVITAIESFRDLAYAAGNLQSDEYQQVSNSDDNIVITQTNETIVYIPYYVPEEVIVYQTRPVYHYYPSAYPVYYYPYAAEHRFRSSFFWGVTTAFSISWRDRHLHVYHPSYSQHPYYGRQYNYHHNYRRTNIRSFNRFYVDNNVRRPRDRYNDGSYWRPQRGSGTRLSNRRDRNYARTRSNVTSTLNGNRRFAGERANAGNRDGRRNAQTRVNGGLGENRANRRSAGSRSVSNNRNVGANTPATSIFTDRNSNRLNRNNATTSNERRRESNVDRNRSTSITRETRQGQDDRRSVVRRGGTVANSLDNARTGIVPAAPARENRARNRNDSDRVVTDNRQRRDSTNRRTLTQNRTDTSARRSTRTENPSSSRIRQQTQISPTRQNRQVINRTNSARNRVDSNRRAAAVESRTRQTRQSSSSQRSAPPNRRTESPRRNRSSAPAVSRNTPSSSRQSPRQSSSGNNRRDRGARREP